jgi:hypothetical protein
MAHATRVLPAKSLFSGNVICSSTMPWRFSSPQRVKARCFAVFAWALGWVEFSRVESRTSRAAEGSSPARQIRSANASILSSLEGTKKLSMMLSPESTQRTSAGSHGSLISRP